MSWLAWLLQVLLDWGLKHIIDFFKQKKIESDNQAIADANVKKDAEAMKSGDLDAIAKVGENLLNNSSGNG